MSGFVGDLVPSLFLANRSLNLGCLVLEGKPDLCKPFLAMFFSLLLVTGI